LTCFSNASCMSLRFSAVSPTNAKVRWGQAEQFPFKSGLPLGVTVISNSGFFVSFPETVAT
jgi:hypothetical protein